jgi:hypothetical protein
MLLPANTNERKIPMLGTINGEYARFARLGTWGAPRLFCEHFR